MLALQSNPISRWRCNVNAVDNASLKSFKPFSFTEKKSLKKETVIRPSSNHGKLDKFHRLRTPRAARELSLCVLYQALVSQVDPIEVFEERMRAPKGEAVSREILEKYYHTPVEDNQPLFVNDDAVVRNLLDSQDEETAVEIAVFTAHPYLVYNKTVLSLAEKVINATVARWGEQEALLKALLPSAWKHERLLEITIMHMAVAEMEIVGTPQSVVISEAVELAKRFCDGHAPKVLNGCLGRYVRVYPSRKAMSWIAKDLHTSISQSIDDIITWKHDYS